MSSHFDYFYTIIKKKGKEKMNISEQFGTHLCELRKEKGFTQKEVAEVMQISVSTYANWEQGRREPDLEHLYLLSKIFEVDMNTLFELN